MGAGGTGAAKGGVAGAAAGGAAAGGAAAGGAVAGGAAAGGAAAAGAAAAGAVARVSLVAASAWISGFSDPKCTLWSRKSLVIHNLFSCLAPEQDEAHEPECSHVC